LKPQLGPQHRHHHDEVWENGIFLRSEFDAEYRISPDLSCK
jgi:hypothetical protein